MTILISLFGFAGRFAGDLLTTALGWASSLLFGRVPRSHQVLLVLMMAFSFLWLVLVLALLLPTVGSFLLSATPHPPFVDQQLLGMTLLYGALLVPLGVGIAGYLVPAEGERPSGLAMVRDVLRGYALTPVLSGILIFLAGVGIVRKIRSRSHGWSDIHVPVVMKQGGYDKVVDDLVDALRSAGLEVAVRDAPRMLSAPAALLTAVSGENVRKLRPDRLMEISARDLRIGVYPSDIAISGTTRNRTRARAAMLSRLTTSAAHLTTSAEAQKVEDAIAKVATTDGNLRARLSSTAQAHLDEIDEKLIHAPIPTDEWDILYRIRLQVERDLLIGSKPGTEFPGREQPARLHAPGQ
ncbi:MAG TPA: hypothetical protein VE011_02925 [Candidatus Dormibacteraeota bacterium]|nr:hypothetical protein [Candidatus Dormibacteraeota bacterium]